MTTTRREAVGLGAGAVLAAVASRADGAEPQRAMPDWGAWVSHYDSQDQAKSMAATFSPDKTALSLLFEKMNIDLQGSDAAKLAGSAGFAGHYALTLPDEFPLTGVLLIARGIVTKTYDTGATLTLSLGDAARALQWPREGKQVAAGSATKPADNQDDGTISQYPFDVELFSGEQHVAMGDPPKWQPVPPITLSIGMHARRSSGEGSILFQLNSIDLVLLAPAKA